MGALMPRVDFFGTEISKLIIGGNPVSGASHQHDALDAEMADYYTTEQVKATLRACEERGINTFQFRGDRHVNRIVREYRHEGGGMHWICQTASEYANLSAIIRSALSYDPIAFYVHGTRADNYWKTGKVDQLKADLDVLRQTGRPVGLGSHMPETLMDCEEQGWDVDFYMACAYNVYKTTKGWRESFIVSGERLPECYEDEDRDRMFAFVRQTEKPCLLFKILGAGRNAGSPEARHEAFRYAIENSKPNDALVVGMFPKHSDQIGENAALVEEITAGAGVR